MFRKTHLPPFFERGEDFKKSCVVNKNFSFSSSTYSDYIQWAKKVVRAGRVNLTQRSPEYIQKCIEANVPAESYPKTPSRHGILLVHGLMSSPIGMSSLYEYFSTKNYLVRSLLLPGHGTRPGDLLDVTHNDWLDACRFGINTLRKEVDHVTVIAFSAGTAMSIYLGLTEKSMDSLVLFAPALGLKHPLSYYYAKILHPFRQLSPRINWPIIKRENDYAKYQSIPINAIYQITNLMHKIQHLNIKLEIPLYIVSTTNDETISHQKAINFYKKQSHSLNRGIIYSPESQHELPSSLQLRSSVYPQENILDFSHPSLAISPNHPHYGRHGDFEDFAHYLNNKKPKNDKSRIIYQGSISERNLKKHLIQRLSYNPDFEYLISDIEHFLEECFSQKCSN